MFDTVAGLPLHPLIVHASVVMIPIAAITVLGSALSARFRGWAGPVPLLLTAASLVLYPISTESGESLEQVVGHEPLIEKHAELADGLLPWLIVLAVAAVAVTWCWWRERSERSEGRDEQDSTTGRVVLVAVAALSLVAAIGTGQQVVRIGHSGAESAWGDTVSGN
ncbi:DUF2231 domain-containing protein [Kineosporia sp. NBRC 101731]|uniref:DUF2231 domain-containing protein n=1 Tax=Kineosporia sp. NBRC 101731 TaxID=3032199 RepID=UPI0024A45B45|nr:DUF2231 domain-containing protein [Kineosporia sp. NBRC 101731]GLY33820.1 hypothetical protein Kisp02_71850 [Kineosporia sp. NBRC 101731]